LPDCPWVSVRVVALGVMDQASMAMVVAVEVAALKLASPEYSATIGCDPAARLVVKNVPVASPRLVWSMASPMGEVPSSKVTEPVGMVEVGMALDGVPETVAVKLTRVPARATGLEAVSVT